jgi:hypothetical protein
MMLGNGHKISSYTVAVAKQLPISDNRRKVFSAGSRAVEELFGDVSCGPVP